MIARGWLWCMFSGFIAAVGITGTGMLIYRATSDQSFGVEPDYYAKALAWNETAEQKEVNARLNWSVVVRNQGAGTATVEVRDSSGMRVEGARISVVAFANDRSSQRYEVAGLETDRDGYRLQRASDRNGAWHLRLRIERGNDVFTWEGDHQFLNHGSNLQ